VHAGGLTTGESYASALYACRRLKSVGLFVLLMAATAVERGFFRCFSVRSRQNACKSVPRHAHPNLPGYRTFLERRQPPERSTRVNHQILEDRECEGFGVKASFSGKRDWHQWSRRARLLSCQAAPSKVRPTNLNLSRHRSDVLTNIIRVPDCDPTISVLPRSSPSGCDWPGISESYRRLQGAKFNDSASGLSAWKDP
jgi:hypothetical protein